MIHFYWVDENGNEEMMKRVDYGYFNNAQKENFGDPKMRYDWNKSVKHCDWHWFECLPIESPAAGGLTLNANGFGWV